MKDIVRVTGIVFMLVQVVMGDRLRELCHKLLNGAVFIFMRIKHHPMSYRETYGDKKYIAYEFFHVRIITKMVMRWLFDIKSNFSSKD